MAYQRVLLKLSGEEFGGGQLGVDPSIVSKIAEQIADVVRGGTQVAVVVGGGNYFRGADLRHFFQFTAQDFVDVSHLIKVIAAVVIHPFHHLIGAERLLAHVFEKLAHLLTV